MRETRILIAEDDAAHRKLLVLALSRAGAEVDVVIAQDLAQATAALRAQRFDCIVLDFHLRGHTAADVVREAEATQPGTPWLVVSASEEQRVAIEALRLGAADFLHKDDAVSGRTLWEHVSAAIDRSRTRFAERREVNRRMRDLERLSDTDELTGLHNRRAMEQAIATMRDGRGDRRGLTGVAFLDVDRFKQINDTHGHLSGDEVLRQIARTLRRCASNADILSRWGGEEFVVVRQSETLIDLWCWADDLRAEIASDVRVPGNGQTVTASVGVEVVGTGSFSCETIDAADHAMYLAKTTGRDRVCTADMARAIETARALGDDSSLTTRQRLAELVNRLSDRLGPTQREHVGPHGRCVRSLVERVARQLTGVKHRSEALAFAAEFHDIGKLGVPEEVLAAPRRLTAQERRIIDLHARLGADIVRACRASFETTDAIAGHHLRFDNSHEQHNAPSTSAIISACDAFVVMTSPRPYAKARGAENAMRELTAMSGSQFHPAVVEAIRIVSEQNHRTAA